MQWAMKVVGEFRISGARRVSQAGRLTDRKARAGGLDGPGEPLEV